MGTMHGLWRERKKRRNQKPKKEARMSLCGEQKYQKLLDLLGCKRKILWQDKQGRLEGAYLEIIRVGHGMGKDYDKIAYVWLSKRKGMTIQVCIDSIRSVDGEW